MVIMKDSTTFHSESVPPRVFAVLRVFARFLRPSQPYTISLAPYSKAFMRIPAAIFGLLSRRLCDSVLLIRAARWALSGADARPRFNSTTLLLSNMTMLEIGTICNKTSVMVGHFHIASTCKDACLWDKPSCQYVVADGAPKCPCPDPTEQPERADLRLSADTDRCSSRGPPFAPSRCPMPC